ncbi:hypothetical protein SLE2022_318350 [Rubroshorea leprosula]
METIVEISKIVWNYVDHHRKLEEDLNELRSKCQIASAMGRRLPDDEEVMMRAAALMDIMGNVGRNLKVIVEECASLPLAIVVIAGSMRGVDDVNAWRNALTELQDRVRSVKVSNDEIFKQSRFSFDRLDSLEVKNCFLYSSFFQEDYVFSRRELIECWIDEGLIDGSPSRETTYNRGHAIIDRFEKNFLLEKDTFWSSRIGSDGAKMHDVMRDMATMSIGPEFGYMIKVEISKSFFEEMLALKVLDLSSIAIETLPNSLSKLKNQSTLQCQLCKKLKYLPSLANLKGLKKLNLHGARIEVFPQGMWMLRRLEYLDLKDIPIGILSNLSSLQYLALNDVQSATTYSLLLGNEKDMIGWSKYELVICDCEIGKECIVLPNNLEYLWIIEGKNMRSSLNKTILLEKANELRSCHIRDNKEIECLVKLDSSSCSLCCPILDKLELLELSTLPRLCVLVKVEGAATPPQVFSNLKELDIWECSRMRKLLPLELLHALQNLEVIIVLNCTQMEEIITSLDLDTSSLDKFTFTFPKLRELSLWNLPQLKSIYNANGVMLDNGQSFPPPHLREIKIGEESKEWWESVEWDHPNAKNLLQPFLKYSSYPWD